MKIISGGQTGIDRIALDVAMQLKFEVGGYCPKGRLAEDGKIPPFYPLIECNSKKYSVRTIKNIEISDATLIFYTTKLHGGTLLTYQKATQLGKNYLLINDKQFSEEKAAQKILNWLLKLKPTILNIAGPRKSKCKNLDKYVKNVLFSVLSKYKQITGE